MRVPSKRFGCWLERLRRSRGFSSAAKLSRAAGIAVAHVATIERGEILPKWTTAQKIAKALGLSPAEKSEFYGRLEMARRTRDVAAALGGAASGADAGASETHGHAGQTVEGHS